MSVGQEKNALGRPRDLGEAHFPVVPLGITFIHGGKDVLVELGGASQVPGRGPDPSRP